MRGEQLRNTALLLGVGIATVELSQYAFTSKSRWSIKDRAIERLGYLGSEVSGIDNLPLECAHIDHNRRHKFYNDPSNGLLVTTPEHLIDHILREGDNGLTRTGNQEAIRLLTHKVFDLPHGRDLLVEVYNYAESPDALMDWNQKLALVLGAST